MSEHRPISSRGTDLRYRTERLALQIIRVFREVRGDAVGRVLGPQLLRAGTSIGANYRSACRSRSRREFVARMAVAVEEADETLYWLGVLRGVDVLTGEGEAVLRDEVGQLLRILVASLTTARAGLSRK